MVLAPDTSSSIVVTVSGSSATFSTTMEATGIFVFISTTNCWIAQGSVASPPTAVANANTNVYIPAGVGIPISGRAGAKLAVIQDTAGGKACLFRSAAY